MRILFVTQWFDPEPFFKALPFAKELVRLGHTVEVLTGYPNYPGGKIYPGYRIKLFCREEMDGVSIIRVALYPSHDQSAFKRVLNYLSFALSATILGPFLVKKADIAYVYHPPPTVGIAAIALRFLRGIPFVYDVQDLWPDSLAATGMIRNKAALGIVRRFCNMIYGAAAAITVLSPGFKNRLVERGVPAEKIRVIYNWAPDDGAKSVTVQPEGPCPSGFENRFNIIFAGNMGPAQALTTVLTAANQLKTLLPVVQFIFVGSGISVPELKKFAEERQIMNVRFLPRVTPREAAEILAHADVLLVHLKNDPLFVITIPSKTQAYLAAGKPILVGVHGDAAKLVETADAGFSFKPEDAADLVQTIQKIYHLSPEQRAILGENGRNYYYDNLSLNAGVAAFDTLFSSVATT